MGHSAKCGAYTVFSCCLPLIITFSLVQKSSQVLTKISKESGGSALVEWIKPCINHFYWSATSTLSGNGNVIYAKFKSFLSHIINKHDKLDEPLFSKCAHGEIEGRKWLTKDSPVYEKICKALSKTSLVNAIKQASPIAQTSCLEGFHSVVNFFSPKVIAYSYAGMYCRHIIAAMHFNLNLQREIKKNQGGSDQVKVVWPKFKNGEATVRDVRVKPDFGYVEDIYQSFLVAHRNDQLSSVVAELKTMTQKPMNTMLERQDKEEAIKIKEERKRMKVVDVPRTTPTASVKDKESARPTKTPLCSACKETRGKQMKRGEINMVAPFRV